jgi:AAA domain
MSITPENIASAAARIKAALPRWTPAFELEADVLLRDPTTQAFVESELREIWRKMDPKGSVPTVQRERILSNAKAKAANGANGHNNGIIPPERRDTLRIFDWETEVNGDGERKEAPKVDETHADTTSAKQDEKQPPAGDPSQGTNARQNGAGSQARDDGAGTAKTKRSRFEPIRLDAITLDRGAVYLIDGLLPAGPAFGLTVGLPKSLKSFLLMLAGLCIAAGLPFAGREVKRGAVVYVTSEGIRGVKRRLISMRKALGIEGKDVPFFLVSAMPNLGTGTEDLKELIVEIEKALAGCGYQLAMTVIDTIRRATPGKDESSSKDMGVYVQNADAITAKFQCLVMSAHHSPRSAEGRGSGSNALDGAADIIWAITRDGNSLTATATIAWMKDGDGEGTTWEFTLRPVIISDNQKGEAIEPVGSCVVEVTTEAREPDSANKADKSDRPKKDPWLTGSLSDLKRVLTNILLDQGKNCRPYPDGPQVRAVDVEKVRAEFLRRYVASGDNEDKKKKAKEKAWQRAIKDATKFNLVAAREVDGTQLVWFAREDTPS